MKDFCHKRKPLCANSEHWLVKTQFCTPPSPNPAPGHTFANLAEKKKATKRRLSSQGTVEQTDKRNHLRKELTQKNSQGKQ